MVLRMDLEALAEHSEAEVIVGFFDLMGYAKWCEGRPPREVLEFAAALFTHTGGAIAQADGVLVKAIGDAGLFVFPAEDPDRAVRALRQMKRACDAWLSERDYPDVMSVKVLMGPVACGRVGAPNDERLDVYGTTVNRAAMMGGRTFAVGTRLVDRLTLDSRRGLAQLSADEFVAED